MMTIDPRECDFLDRLMVVLKVCVDAIARNLAAQGLSDEDVTAIINTQMAEIIGPINEALAEFRRICDEFRALELLAAEMDARHGKR